MAQRLTNGQYIDLMSHALGKTPDSRHDLYATYNDAGRALFSEHHWTWRQVGPTTLTVLSGNDFVDLPADMGGVVTAWVIDASSFDRLALVPLETIAALRASTINNVQSGLIYIHFPMWAGQSSPDEQPTRRAIIYPTAAADITINLVYRKDWSTVTTGDSARIPSIPDKFERALKLISRSMAWHLENQSPCQEDSDYIAEIARLKIEDASMQTTVGKMTGGADRRMYRQRGPRRYPQQAEL